MENRKIFLHICLLLLAAFLLPATARAQKKTDLVSVSADIVEISGNLQTNVGFAWVNTVDFLERDIPGVLSIGSFQRQTLLSTRLQLMENEGRAQILANPKVVTKSGTQATLTVGGKIPMPVVGPTGGIGSDNVDYGINLTVLPTIVPERGKIINLQIEFESSQPDYSKVVVIGTGTYPSYLTRKINTWVELNSGETLVIGGLKSSSRNIAEGRVPFLGRIPLIGALFKSRDVSEEQRSMFLFLTVEIVE
jgi:pilus assembly protein CpaC